MKRTHHHQLQNIGRALSEMSPLNPSTSNEQQQQHSSHQDIAQTHSGGSAAGSGGYGSLLPYFGFFRQSMGKSASAQALNRYGESMGSLGHRALLQYLDSNDLYGLKTFLDTRHLPVDDRDENGTTVLMVASARGLAPFVREFIARGADIQSEDFDNWTALLFAAKNGHFDIVQMLLEHGAELEHRDMGGWTALMWAAYRGNTEIAAYLLDRGADVHAHGNFHLSPLLWAAGRGHKEIVQLLLQRGVKVNVGDKYGTTALVWACRKGNAEIVEILLKAGANVDTAGMYSWTPLLVAVSGGFLDCVTLLLEKKPNVNALDKDGMTALAIACREGQLEIGTALMACGAYINIQDRAGDTPLIHAVKGGHRAVVEALLKKHADVDIQGKERKTGIYTAIEKGHVSIAKLLIASNPDLEIATKDGDTPLLRGVRNRNLELVQLLLERRAKPDASDRRGDTCLHIAMRARSKAIVEALLRNPKNSKLLYKANKAGETPYQIDTLHQKTIMGQVFGARNLNTNAASEGMLGYELYSSALADVLSDPTLTTPINVGLYAKWGSGKSFLLNKLKEEMKSFAREWAEPSIRAPWLLFALCLHFAIFLGTVVGLAAHSAIWGILTAVLFVIVVHIALLSIKFAGKRYDVYWAYSFHHGLMKRLGKFRLIIQVAFCHPPDAKIDSQPKPIRFHFAEASSAAPTGEGAVAIMLAYLYDAIETHYGTMSTRLYRAFRPKSQKMTSSWRWRRVCCIPLVIIFEIALMVILAAVAMAIVYFTYRTEDMNKENILVAIGVLCGFLIMGLCVNFNICFKTIYYLFISQGRHLKSELKQNKGAPLTALGTEVALMTDMVQCLDAFTSQQSRLVGVVDALDSCDTERILSVLSSLQTLLSAPNRPFVLLIAVDPHVIAKAAEATSRRLFTEGGIGGHDFLRNLVHLPVYLQNSGLRKVQRAQLTASLFKRHYTDNQNEETTLGHSASARRLSNASEIMSSQEKLRAPQQMPSRGGSKKLRLSESVASSIGSNLHRLGQNPQGVFDFSKIILTDDYFSDINPRSIRRLMNVTYITVRLLKAFQIDFSWYRLTSWINLTEQWPFRTSMIVLQHDQMGESLEDTVSLQSVYDKVRPKIPQLRESAPLLELDRDERKLDAFLQLHKSDLLVADLRILLPFTINLDPYLRKVLKEDQQTIEDENSVERALTLPVPKNQLQQQAGYMAAPPYGQPNVRQFIYENPYAVAAAGAYINYVDLNGSQMELHRRKKLQQQTMDGQTINSQVPTNSSENDGGFPEDVLQQNLSELSVEGVIRLVERIEDLRPTMDELAPKLRENAINGKVLKHCNLNELKTLLGLNFGHWELFKLLITSLRNCEKAASKSKLATDVATIAASTSAATGAPLTSNDSTDTYFIEPRSRKNSSHMMEKQVTLEEQMICGALQTLNEEAFEDVISSERSSPSGGLATESFDLTLSSVNASHISASSPITIRRDSILKQSGSAKTDKRVSIKQENFSLPTNIEIVCEKRKTKNNANSSTGSRPASLILTRGDRSQIKLVRSSSIDYDDINNTETLSQKTNKETTAALLDEISPLVLNIKK